MTEEQLNNYYYVPKNQLNLITLSLGGLAGMNLLIENEPTVFVEMIHALVFSRLRQLEKEGKLLPPDVLKTEAWKELKTSGPDWWKAVPPEMFQHLSANELNDLPPEAFDEVNTTG